MSGDYSRVRFDPKKHFSGVLMQQGRVQLDADWNELIALLDRRWRAETMDIIGRCVVPKETPDGFRIQIAAGKLTIGRGRMYVHGLLAENHGKEPLEFDPVLAEQRGTLPIPYEEQPYFPNVSVAAPAPTTGGPHLAYLDVWQREVTFLEDPALVENAVGVDTTARSQTVWQVKVLPSVGTGGSCGSEIQAWDALVAPSDARLSTAAVGTPTNTDPCLLPPSGGYRGLDNRLYRVEIQDGGAAGVATFKWSRDNASVATSVTAITALDKLTVASVGRDSVMHFKIGDWVEITDDWLEFARQPGVTPMPLAVIAQVKSVDDANRIVTLTSAIPAGVFATDGQGNTDPTRHTRVKRWDQSGEVRDTNGNLIVDLNTSGSKGVIPVPATGTSIVLEDGVQITFDTPAGGNYKAGDYWNFAARTADASVEELLQAPPLGVHHHFCRLALFSFPGTPTDCRTFWPPDFGGEGKGCECTVCVEPEAHNSGAFTIQLAIDQVKAAGGGTICLEVGTYNLGEAPIPININGARSIKLRGKGVQTILIYAGKGPAIVVDGSTDVTIEELALITAATEGETQPAIRFTDNNSVLLERCLAMRLGTTVNSAVVGLGGLLMGTIIRENVFLGPIGVGNTPGASTPGTVVPLQSPLMTLSLYVQDNAFFCSRRGISFIGVSLHGAETRLAGNFMNDCAQGGIIVLGFVPSGSSLGVDGNELRQNGPGIIVGTSGARITSNSITAIEPKPGADGIVLAPGLDKTGMAECHVIGNSITSVGGNGISVLGVVKSVMIKNNFIDGAFTGGIVMQESSSADFITVENNQISGIVAQPNDPKAAVFGIRLVDAKRAEVANNAIASIGLQAANQHCVGIQLLASAVATVSGNQVNDIGPPAGNAQISAGIECLGTFDHIQINNNVVRRGLVALPAPDASQWYAVLVAGAKGLPTKVAGINMFFAAKINAAFMLSPNRILAQQLGGETVSLRGNVLEAYGISEAVLVVVVGGCTFNDNQCVLRGRQQPVVQTTSATAIVSSNNVQGSGGDISISLHLPTEKPPVTVLGNITTKLIFVNNSALTNPWAPFNILLT